MVIRIPGDPERARQALEQRRQRRAEEAAQRSIEVQEAVANGDVVQMATLWLDRKGHLAGDRCAESLRDIQLLTPELAHAANDAGLPYDWMLSVRDLKGSSSLFTAGPIINLMARAALQIQELRFAAEAKQRAANRNLQALAPAAHADAASPTLPHPVADKVPTNTADSNAEQPAGEAAMPDAPQNPDQTNANPEQVKPRGRLLLSWDEILDVLGLPKERREEARIKRLNDKRSGPIVYVGSKPKVFSEVLLRWVDDLGKKVDHADDESVDPNLELNHPAEMKKLGFQPKVRPNNSGSSAQKSGHEAP